MKVLTRKLSENSESEAELLNIEAAFALRAFSPLSFFGLIPWMLYGARSTEVKVEK